MTNPSLGYSLPLPKQTDQLFLRWLLRSKSVRVSAPPQWDNRFVLECADQMALLQAE